MKLVPNQVGYQVTTTIVGDSQGVVTGVLITVTHPKPTGGFWKMTTDRPVPLDRMKYYVTQFKREIERKIEQSRGIVNNHFISYLEKAA